MARLPDDEIQRRYEEALEKVEISDEEALGRWPNMTTREREQRRQSAIRWAAKHATIIDDATGQRLLGGAQPKRSKQGVMEVIAELADGDRQREVIDALFAPLDKNNDDAVRGKGAERIVRLRIEHDEIQRRDREELRQLDKDALLDRLVEGILGSGSMSGDLMKKLSAGAAAAKVSANGTAYDVDVSAEDAAV